MTALMYRPDESVCLNRDDFPTWPARSLGIVPREKEQGIPTSPIKPLVQQDDRNGVSD